MGESYEERKVERKDSLVNSCSGKKGVGSTGVSAGERERL